MWYKDSSECDCGEIKDDKESMMKDMYIHERYGYIANSGLNGKYRHRDNYKYFGKFAMQPSISFFWFAIGVAIVSIMNNESMTKIFGIKFEVIASLVISFEYIITRVLSITKRSIWYRIIARFFFYPFLIGLCSFGLLLMLAPKNGSITEHYSDLKAHYNRVLYENSMNLWEPPEHFSPEEKTMFMKLSNYGGCKGGGSNCGRK